MHGTAIAHGAAERLQIRRQLDALVIANNLVHVLLTSVVWRSVEACSYATGTALRVPRGIA